MEELAAIATIPCSPPLLRPDEPRQEPPDLLLAAAALLFLLLPLPGLPARLFLPRSRRFPGGRHQRLREGGDVDEGAPADDVHGAGVGGERGMVERRGAVGGVRGGAGGRTGGPRERGGGRGRGGEVGEAIAEAARAHALG